MSNKALKTGRKILAFFLIIMGASIILSEGVFSDIGENVYYSILIINLGIISFVIGILLFRKRF
jgi:hypothetical protein